MKHRRQFPAIVVAKNEQGYGAAAAMDLKSLLLGGLFRQPEPSAHAEMPNRQGAQAESDLRSGREGLLRALAAWGSESSLELRFTAFPDFTIRQRGRLRISMVLRASAASRAAAREKTATQCLSLRAALKTHMPEAEFTPVTGTAEFGEIVKPFRAAHAVSIHRRREEIPLSAPYARKTIGLESGLTRETRDGYTNEGTS